VTDIKVKIFLPTFNVGATKEQETEFIAEPFARHTVEDEVDGGVDNDAQLGHRVRLVHHTKVHL